MLKNLDVKTFWLYCSFKPLFLLKPFAVSLMFYLISLAGILMFPFTVYCQITYQSNNKDYQSYYQQSASGWNWYFERNYEANANRDPNSVSDPIVEVKTLHRRVEYALDRAFLNPTPEHVKDYIILQNQVTSQASEFAKVWKLVLIQNPSLNYSLKYPTNQIGRQVYWDQLNETQEKALHEFSKRNGLFFFYRSSCPYCQKFSPIVKDFSQRYGISVIPITTDGIKLPEFPDSRKDQGQSQQFQVQLEPALFTVNPYNHKAIPVTYGLISENELRERILEIAKAREGI